MVQSFLKSCQLLSVNDWLDLFILSIHRRSPTGTVNGSPFIAFFETVWESVPIRYRGFTSKFKNPANAFRFLQCEHVQISAFLNPLDGKTKAK